MKLRSVDFESTDKPERRQKGTPVGLCEIGYTDVDGATGSVSKPYSALVNCGVPIAPEARGIHHISDEDVAGAITPDAALAILLEGMEPGDVFVAHNAQFEKSFFSGGVFPWICTLQCARHLWPDSPGHSNQTLRYWLGVDEEFQWPEQAMPPHRAGPDSYVTAHILSRMVKEKHPSALIQLTNTPILMKTVPFGIHEGKPWETMEIGYLQWCLDPQRTFRADQKEMILHTARHWLNKLTMSGTPFA